MADALFIVLRKVALTLGEGALEKIGHQVLEAAPVITDFKHGMKQIEGELSILQAFICQASARRASDKAFDAWLDQVRDVAHEVEDIIDEYAYLTAQAVDTSSFFKRKFHQIKNIAAWQKFPSQIIQVEARIQRLAEMRKRYGFSVGELDRNNDLQVSSQICLSRSAYLIDNSEIVGHADEIGKLTQCLLEEKQDRSLISILGMGRLGKTAIAGSVYKNKQIRTYYDCHAWVTVSQIDELLREIINQLIDQRSIMDSGFMTMSRMRLIEVIQNYLQDKKYFIVLDDVWDKDAWLFLNYAFVRNKCGSKVLITTRRKDVSSLAVDNYVIELKTLPCAESWELFVQKVFHTSKDNTCPEHLMPLAEKIVAKCQGLPLAIVTIGSTLSYREFEVQEWAYFYKQLSWQLAYNSELNWIFNVLNMSLHDLPIHLRSCFLYCSLYPEDYKIRRKLISKLWIAEGFVEDSGDGTTMEEVAEYYLTELTQRSLLQVTERKTCGRARTFVMHDLVREATSIIAKKEKSGIAYSGACITQATHEVRHLSIQRVDCFSATKIPGNICRLKNLQALGSIQANKNLVSHLGNMTLMRSLGIMKVRQSYIAELWSSLTKMPNLSKLLISECDMDEILNLDMLEALPNLKALWMAGKLEGGMLLPLFAEFENLKWLKLDWSGLKKDPISFFSHMLNLVDLRLYGAYGGQQIEIEEGTMMSLHVLELSSLRNLKSVPEGIKYITTLHHMFLVDMSTEFIERLQGSDNHIVQHVRNIHKFGPSDSQAEFLAQKYGPGAIKYVPTK